MSFPKKSADSSMELLSRSSLMQKKKQFHRRTQSNSDFATTSQTIFDNFNRLSTPQNQQSQDKGFLKATSLTETNLQQSPQQPNPENIKKNQEDKQIIIETLDLTPQEQLKMAGAAGYGSITPGFFRFGKKKTLENCPKFMELMMTNSPPHEEEKRGGNEHNELLEIDVSPLKEHGRHISINFNRINEESMETESNISKRSSFCCKLSISKQKKDSVMLKSDFIETIAEILQAEEGKKAKEFKNKLRKKGHSKSCLSFNLHAFNLKLKNYIENKKSMSIRKHEILFSDSHSKVGSSHTNSMMNFSHTQQGHALRKKSDESLMINNLNSSIMKHKKTSTSLFNPKFKNVQIHDKDECVARIQEFDQKIKEMEKTIGILQEKTSLLEKENVSLSYKIIDATNEKIVGDMEKEEYKKTIKDLERRIKDNENNIKRIFNLMVHTDSTMLTNDWKQQQSFPSFSNSQNEISLTSPKDFIDFSRNECSEKIIDYIGDNMNHSTNLDTPKQLINLISAAGSKSLKRPTKKCIFFLFLCCLTIKNRKNNFPVFPKSSFY